MAAAKKTEPGTGLVYPTRDELMALPVGKLAEVLREAREYMATVAAVVNARAGEQGR